MNLKELYEGTTPKLPGAAGGIQIMTPQQFIAKSAQGEEPEPEQEVSESSGDTVDFEVDSDNDKAYNQVMKKFGDVIHRHGDAMVAPRKYWGDIQELVYLAGGEATEVGDEHIAEGDLDKFKKYIRSVVKTTPKIERTTNPAGRTTDHVEWKVTTPTGEIYRYKSKKQAQEHFDSFGHQGVAEGTADDIKKMFGNAYSPSHAALQRVALLAMQGRQQEASGRLQSVIKDASPKVQQKIIDAVNNIKPVTVNGKIADSSALDKSKSHQDWISNTFIPWVESLLGQQGVAEGKGKATCGCGSECKHCSGKHSLKEVGKKCSCCGNMIKLSMAEATALPASTRELKGQELTDYLDRIRNQDKKKTDKYNLPYVHRSSVVGYYNAEGKKYDTDAIKKGLAQKPEKLLKKNEKMKHSDGAQEQFFNIGFAALVGIALDENTNELIVVNTCPGAGSCKVDCFAMKGGKVQFAGPWLSDGRILTYLLNHPNEFFEQLKSEITKEAAKGQKGGYSVSIRWHDAGDFFSPEYMDMAFKLAQSLPNVKFYAYTKVASAAMASKPSNFIINWSEGAHTSQEKQIKKNDPNLDITKNSRIVPSSLFYDLLVKDEKKNLIKGPEGQWQVIPDELPELKQRLADKYNISKNSILSYDEWNTKGKHNKSMKWNVIVAPGEPDLTANDPGVLSTLLLKH
jgi:hypothetical protein